MDNRDDADSLHPEEIVKFLGITGNISKIYLSDNIKVILEYIRDNTLWELERDSIFKRLFKVMESDNNTIDLCKCLEFLIDPKKEDCKNNFKFSPFRSHLNKILDNLDKENIRDLAYLSSLPADHVFYALTSADKFNKAVEKNKYLLLQRIDTPEDFVEFAKCQMMVENLSSLMNPDPDMRDFIVQACNKWRALLRDVESFDKLNNLKKNTDNYQLKKIIEERIADLSLEIYEKDGSLAVLFLRYADIEKCDVSSKRLKNVILDPDNVGKGLNDICGYIEKEKDVITKTDKTRNIISSFLETMSDIKVLSIYFHKIENLEPVDVQLLNLIRNRCEAIVGRMPLREPSAWFIEYIRNPSLIPPFIKEAINKKAKNMIGA